MRGAQDERSLVRQGSRERAGFTAGVVVDHTEPERLRGRQEERPEESQHRERGGYGEGPGADRAAVPVAAVGQPEKDDRERHDE